MSVDISIITPTFNEEETIVQCIEVVRDTMRQKMPSITYEHIISDNFSTDGTAELVRKIAAVDANLKLVVNSRNIGALQNIYRAMSKASGASIIPMLPADLQDSPEVIPEFYRKWKAGSLVVFGRRGNRQENHAMRFARGAYYRVIRKFAKFEIPIDSGEFMLLDKRVVASILQTKDQFPYIRGMAAQSVSYIDSIQYTWKARKSGKSKMNFLSLVDIGINGLISTSRAPARIALLAGFLLSILGIVFGVWTFLAIMLGDPGTSRGIPTIIVGMFLIGGAQLFFLGLIGEYVLSIHSQVRPAPSAFDLELVNFKN